MSGNGGECEVPHKTPYENRGAAKSALRRMKKIRKGQGLHAYQCGAQHWHLGRVIRRARVAWRSEP